MRRILLGSAAVAAAFAVLPVTSATAEGCGAGGSAIYGALGDSDGTTVAIGFGKAGDGTIYLDDRGFGDGGNGFWVYQEANNQDGLQRGGTSVMGADLGGHDACTQSDFPDQVIF